MTRKDIKHQVTRDSQRDWHRTIVSLRKSMELFADLVDDPRDIDVLIQHEMDFKNAKQDPAIINRTITLDNEPYTVVGVLPPGSAFDRAFNDIWLPLAFLPTNNGRRASGRPLCWTCLRR